MPPFSDAVPSVVVPSLNVTVPVAGPTPGATTATVAVSVIGTPDSEGVLLDITTVVVDALLIVILNVCAELLTPPFNVPPSSVRVTVTVATPNTPDAGVKVSVPLGATAGCTENSGLLLFVRLKLTA